MGFVKCIIPKNILAFPLKEPILFNKMQYLQLLGLLADLERSLFEIGFQRRSRLSGELLPPVCRTD